MTHSPQQAQIRSLLIPIVGPYLDTRRPIVFGLGHIRRPSDDLADIVNEPGLVGEEQGDVPRNQGSDRS